MADARQEIAEELQPDWEIEGFTVAEEGSIEWYPDANDPERKLPMYRLDVSKDVPTLEDAVETIRWVRIAETEIWM